MPEIPGKYVWDDADLTPGKKKEGGLHQNLFDDEGNLKANARFIPDEEQTKREPEPEVVYEPVFLYDEADDRQRALEQQESAQKLAEAATLVVAMLVAATTPHAKRWWQESARPAIHARRARRAERKAQKATVKGLVVAEATVVESTQDLIAAAEDVYRADMTSAEAQARYIAALAAKHFSNEQMRLVANANIVNGQGLEALQQTLAELSPEQVKGIIEAVEAKPDLLNDELLAELGKLFGREAREPQPAPIEKSRPGSPGHERA